MSFLFPSATITFEAALRDLRQGSPKARAFAAHALGGVTDPAERRRAAEALMGALDDDRPEVRAEACAALGELREVMAIAALAKRLTDGTAPVRQCAAIALGSLGELARGAGFDALVETLREGPADARFQAATSLAEIDAAAAYGPICGALSDRDPQVVGAAALSLGAIGDRRAVPLLLDKLNHEDAGTRFDVAYGLAELGQTAGREILAAALVDAERAWDAVTALALLEPPELALLRGALTNKKVSPEATVLAAGAILRREPGDEPARRVLLAALAARKVHVRGLAVEQLEDVGGSWAVMPLEKLARGGKGAELVEAIGAALRKIDERKREEDDA
ncbi:MAG: HEAT repeat domain-containing protein [Deltaproteobacteria bacterium]|nr:HEAT repeat domain-containing protein [Deltaproteobacteria bacterium]